MERRLNNSKKDNLEFLKKQDDKRNEFVKIIYIPIQIPETAIIIKIGIITDIFLLIYQNPPYF